MTMWRWVLVAILTSFGAVSALGDGERRLAFFITDQGAASSSSLTLFGSISGGNPDTARLRLEVTGNVEGINKSYSIAMVSWTEQELTKIRADMAGLREELRAADSSQEKALRDFAQEMLVRIDRVPLDLLRDERTYELLKDRLKLDLAESIEDRLRARLGSKAGPQAN